MAKLLSKREHIEIVDYRREFHRSDTSGYSFECNADGVIDTTDFADSARVNLALCLSGADPNLVDAGVREYRHSYTQPATVRCDCGAIVELYAFTNCCDRCGADYNMSGDRLAPRSQWGEETGETLADILGPELPDNYY